MFQDDTAYLSNVKDIISFTFRSKTIRFKGPYSLSRFATVKEWDNKRGYIVADVIYEGETEPVEDYIDLLPILNNLYIDKYPFLNLIQNVEVIDA